MPTINAFIWQLSRVLLFSKYVSTLFPNTESFINVFPYEQNSHNFFTPLPLFYEQNQHFTQPSSSWRRKHYILTLHTYPCVSTRHPCSKTFLCDESTPSHSFYPFQHIYGDIPVFCLECAPQQCNANFHRKSAVYFLLLR